MSGSGEDSDNVGGAASSAARVAPTIVATAFAETGSGFDSLAVSEQARLSDMNNEAIRIILCRE